MRGPFDRGIGWVSGPCFAGRKAQCITGKQESRNQKKYITDETGIDASGAHQTKVRSTRFKDTINRIQIDTDSSFTVKFIFLDNITVTLII